MTAEDLWTTARRLLGVYFIVTGLIALPGVVTLFEATSEGQSSWLVASVAITQYALALAAGVWLVRGAASRAAGRAPAAPAGSMASVLQVLGVYFLVDGFADIANSGVTMLLVSEPWSSGTVSITQAAVEFTAGLLLVTRPSAISTWMADRRAAG